MTVEKPAFKKTYGVYDILYYTYIHSIYIVGT